MSSRVIFIFVIKARIGRNYKRERGVKITMVEAGLRVKYAGKAVTR